ncbi:MAG: putative intraflagellar transport protein 172, partial [Streblomastix strix]
FEGIGDFETAIDACLRANPGSTGGARRGGSFVEEGDGGASPDELQEIWLNAVRLSLRCTGVNRQSVAAEVGRKLESIGRFESAASVLKESGQIGKAIQANIKGRQWEKAMTMAKGTEFESMVGAQFVEYMKSQKKATELLQYGHIKEAIDVFIERGEWDQVFKAAEKLGNDQQSFYAAQYAEILIQNEASASKSLQVLVKYGANANSEHVNLYKRIAHYVLEVGGLDPELTEEDPELLTYLRKFLTQLLQAAKANPSKMFPLQHFENMNMAAYFYIHKQSCQRLGLKAYAASVSTGLLRYRSFLAIDRAFYEAGQACLDAENLQYAYVFLNKYLDIADDIDNNNPGTNDLPTPDSHFAGSTEKLREQVKKRVIAMAMDKTFEKQIEWQQCAYCGTEIRTSTFECDRCTASREICVVSGMLIPSQAERVECLNCKSPARKDMWNSWIQLRSTCPMCNARGSRIR